MIPAEQRLHSHNQPRRQLDLRLKVEFQLAIFEGVRQIVGKIDAITHLAIKVVRVETILVAAFVLGAVEGKIGLGEHFI